MRRLGLAVSVGPLVRHIHLVIGLPMKLVIGPAAKSESVGDCRDRALSLSFHNLCALYDAPYIFGSLQGPLCIAQLGAQIPSQNSA